MLLALGEIQFQDAQGAPHTIKDAYETDIWNTLQVGQKVLVRYLVADPNVAHDLKSMGAERLDLLHSTAFFGVLFLIGAAMFLYGRALRE